MTSSTRFTSATTATAFGGEALAVRTPAPAMTTSIAPIAREIRTRLLENCRLRNAHWFGVARLVDNGVVNCGDRGLDV
jgi:hypothetical protein